MRGIEQFLQVDAATLGALKYAGTWNASTNTPTLASGVGVQGQYYVVSVAGSTNLDGETNWGVGDWAVFNGSVWQKVDGGSTGLLTTLTVTGNTYLATTSGNVGVGTTSPTAIYGKTLQVGSGTSEATTSLVGSTGSVFLATVGATGQLIARGSTALVLGSNDVERARIDTSGNVGIGTSSPTNKLHVVGSGDILRFTNGTVSLYGYSDSAGLGWFTGAGATNVGVYYNNTSSFQSFYTSSTERMRITATGDVGIGTSSPGQKLSLFASSANVGMRMSSSGGTGRDFDLISNTSGNLVIKSDLQSNILTVDGILGNLGLGVTPSAWNTLRGLDISTGGALFGYTAQVGLANNAFYNGTNWIYKNTDAAAFFRANALGFEWHIAPSGTAGNTISFTQAMTLDASGNLGVGTTSPSYRLDVYKAGAASISAARSDTQAVLRAEVGACAADLMALSTYGEVRTATNHPLLFSTNATERARIPAAGGMVVGTAAIATNATDGFLYVPTCAGTPTGTPTTQTGTAPIVIDTTNNKLYFYSGGAWRDAGP